MEFLNGVDILILMREYTDDEYLHKIGWGQGSLSSVVSLASMLAPANCSSSTTIQIATTEGVDEMVESARMLVLESGKPMEVDAAREGSEVWLGAKISR